MTSKIRIAILTSVILFIGFGEVAFAKGDTEKVLYDNSFEVNDNALLSVMHEMGNVTCKNWDRNEISVKITASVETSDLDKAAKAFERIQYNVVGNRNQVTAECKVKSKKNGSRDSNLQIELEIFMPRTVRLDFQHKFGNAYIEEADGQSNVNSSYGSIQIKSLTHAESKFKLSYGEGNLGYFAGNSINISYSSFTLGEAGNISLKTAYSEVEADEINVVSLKLEGGSFTLGKADILKGSSKFSSLSIERLNEVLEVETEYGSLEVDYVPASFAEIVIDNSYGSTTITIDKSATYKLEATATHCEIDYPDDMADFSYREKTHFKTTLKGIIGKGQDAQSRVTIKSSYGGTSLEAK